MKRMPFHTTALLRRFAAGFFLVAGMLSCSAPQATFTNPLRDGADPWITKYDGRYYTCFKSGRGIAVTESDDMTRFERERVVWQPPTAGRGTASTSGHPSCTASAANGTSTTPRHPSPAAPSRGSAQACWSATRRWATTATAACSTPATTPTARRTTSGPST